MNINITYSSKQFHFNLIIKNQIKYVEKVNQIFNIYMTHLHVMHFFNQKKPKIIMLPVIITLKPTATDNRNSRVPSHCFRFQDGDDIWTEVPVDSCSVHGNVYWDVL